MAIAFAKVTIHSRAKGHSSVAAAAYRTGTKLLDSRTGIIHDYSHRRDVVFSELLLPEGCDALFQNREFLWNQAEFAEKRIDAQVSKDVVLALPKELDLKKQIELATRFAQTHFVDKGLPAEISIHDHGDGTPHAHILISTRRLEKNQFSKYKARDLNPTFAKGFIVENDYWGERWRDFQNDYFEEKNIDLRVDLNHFISERSHGKIKDTDTHYLLEEKQIIQQAREEFALSSPKNIIKHLSNLHSVFTRRDVEKLLFKTFKDGQRAEEYLQIVAQVMMHKNVIKLGANDRGKECYTTRRQYLEEARLRRDIEKMMSRKNHVFSIDAHQISEKYTLSDEQQVALDYIAQSPDISVVIGRPGTGKSYLLKPVKEYFEENNMQVIGAALSGKVAKSLQTETGIASSTIASLAYRLQENRLQLTDKHILIIDEAGMVDFNNMAFIIHEAKKAGSKVVLIGDPEQLKPIHKGEIFKGVAAITGFIELENIKRQRDLGDRAASLNLAKGNVEEALKHYQEKGAVILSDSPQAASETLINAWQQGISKDTLKDTILLAFTRKAVAGLNQQAREALQEKNLIGHENIAFQGFDKELQISTGERLLFRQNDKTLGLRNGDLGTVSAVFPNQFEVKLDSGEKLIIPKSYQKMDYGYALTVHKSQGMTAENTHVLIDSKYWDKHLSYVAMTRHKESLKLYADKINHPNMNDLTRTLSRSITKDNVIDWPLDYAIRAGFNPDKLIGKVVNHLAGVGHKIRNGFNYVVNYEAALLDKEKTQHKLPSLKKATKSLVSNNKQQNAHLDLKTQHPQLAEYEKLMSQSKYKTGYYREKMDRNMQDIAKNISKNKVLMVKIEQEFPKIFSHLSNYKTKNINLLLE